MKTTSLKVLLGAATLCGCLAASAAVVNGNFESGLTGWNSVGPVGNSSTASEGLSSGEMIAQNGGVANAAAVESFVGISDADLQAVKSGFTNFTTGAAIQQTFSANAGDTVSFDWNFLTNEFINSQWDFSFYVLNGAVFALGDTNIGPFNGGAVGGYSHSTGWSNVSFTVGTSGVQTLSFGAMQAGDFSVESALLVDNVTGGSVPEPASLALVGLALVGLGASRRKAKQA